MENFTIALNERKVMLSRLHHDIHIKKGPLTADERSRSLALRREIDQIDEEIVVENRKNYRVAFREWMRRGTEDTQFTKGISAELHQLLIQENRDMIAAGGAAYPGATAGFFVPVKFAKKVETAMKGVSPMLSLSTPIDMTVGAPLLFPTSNDSANIGRIIPENNQAPIADPVISQVQFNAFKFSSLPTLCSLEFVMDSGVDLDSYFSEILGRRVGLAQNKAYTTGSGASEPLGIVNSVTSTHTATGNSGDDGGAGGAGTIGGADLTAVELLLDPAHRAGAKWMAHPNTIAALRRQKDKQGHFLYPGLHNSPSGDQLLNYPLIPNQDLPQLQTQAGSPPTTNMTMLFGRFDKFYWRRQPPILFRFKERFIDRACLAFSMIQRGDGLLIDAGTHPVVGLVNTF